MTITKATCPTCGRGTLEHAGSLFDPIQGALLTRTHGETPEMRQAYLPHVCQDTDIVAFQEKIAVVAQALQRYRDTTDLDVDGADYEDARARVRELVDEHISLIEQHSIENPCSKCDAPVGEKCRNLTERRRGNDVPTAKPHSERLPALAQARIADIENVRERLAAANTRVTEIYERLNADEKIPAILASLREGRF